MLTQKQQRMGHRCLTDWAQIIPLRFNRPNDKSRKEFDQKGTKY